MPVRNATTVHVNGQPQLFGDIQLVQGTNITLSQSGQQITVTGSGGGSVTFSSASIAFTDGDTMRRVTVVDAAVGVTSKVVGTIRRPDTADDSADAGYIYLANVVKVTTGSFDLLISCLGWGFDDPVNKPPNETIQFLYTLG